MSLLLFLQLCLLFSPVFDREKEVTQRAVARFLQFFHHRQNLQMHKRTVESYDYTNGENSIIGIGYRQQPTVSENSKGADPPCHIMRHLFFQFIAHIP